MTAKFGNLHYEVIGYLQYYNVNGQQTWQVGDIEWAAPTHDVR